ncbi:MAG TPA: lanthionine synthetase LanC family protein [Candidatus Saccharimonadia bacterium]|nr:lanthionine synthetase LanC family protein [Candidatus Saccharimonadia bacterium]
MDKELSKPDSSPETPDGRDGYLASLRRMFKNRKVLLAGGALLTIAVVGIAVVEDVVCDGSARPHVTHSKIAMSKNSDQLQAFIATTAQSLLAQGESSNGGLRFRSQIQAPDYQTDRDVGASSIGMGLLAMAKQYPNDTRWIQAAEKTATWLMSVSGPKADGTGPRFWVDSITKDGASSDVYTSFDDGTIGIGDFFWQLYDQTHDDTYKQVALGTLDWTFSQAERVSGGTVMYRWKWNINGDPTYYMGMGEGVSGIINTLATYYDRLKISDPTVAAKCQQYMTGALNYLAQNRSDLGKTLGASGYSRAVSEIDVHSSQDGNTNINSGYLSGAAGAAYMYLNLYKTFGDKAYLDQADQLFSWLGDSDTGPYVDLGNKMATWKLAIDPQGDDTTKYATGFEEGNAGIGWVYLQAYNLTKQSKYLDKAEAAANWLLKVAMQDGHGGLSWHEDENPANSLVHANLNNGAAGISVFFNDIYIATGQTKYQTGAAGALQWLQSSAHHKGSSIYWDDNGGYIDGNSGPSDPYSNDPSWHWGDAGILAAALRVNGGSVDIPGEQPGLISNK